MAGGNSYTQHRALLGSIQGALGAFSTHVGAQASPFPWGTRALCVTQPGELKADGRKEPAHERAPKQRGKLCFQFL